MKRRTESTKKWPECSFPRGVDIYAWITPMFNKNFPFCCCYKGKMECFRYGGYTNLAQMSYELMQGTPYRWFEASGPQYREDCNSNLESIAMVNSLEKDHETNRFERRSIRTEARMHWHPSTCARGLSHISKEGKKRTMGPFLSKWITKKLRNKGIRGHI